MRCSRKHSPPPDTPFPEPAPARPEVVALRRERNRWLSREASLVLGRAGRDDPDVRQARTAHLVLTYALAVVQQRFAVSGSYPDLAGPAPLEPDVPAAARSTEPIGS
ncbi:hypothetical protein ACGFMK_24530 [Amycolatopsis sp. NPDC049252]|uniref:hypothetical protein n=1 Tax=Amycolatopsis sp. NPDC049252 TaxID=3363933 RepID=UPI0037131ABB